MDFETQLLKEHSRNNTDAIVKAIGNNEIEFKKIIDIIYREKAPLPQRASWVLVGVNDKHPELLTPYIPLFLNTIQGFSVDGIKRNMVQVLACQEIEKKLQVKVINLCFDLLLSPNEKVAVKVHAMQAIANIAKHHVELQHELKLVIEDQLPKTTAAFHARAKHILKQIKFR